MRFREHQASARSASRRLVVAFVLTIALTVLGVNLALWLAWRLVMVDMFGTPRLFYEVNTAVTLLFVLGGWWLETLQLEQGGAHVARWLGGREITTPRDLAERRFRNVVHEMAIASGLPLPRVFVLDREDAINAFAAGWVPEDSAIAVTQGALLRLTRHELQGVVAHEFGHIRSGDTRLNMRLIGMVFGLQMVYTLGQTLAERDQRGRHSALAVLGWALMAAGSIGWLAGRLLKAAVSRQREFLADAHAVQYTRLPRGLGQALLKVAGQRTQGERLHHPRAELVSHLLLSSDVWVRGGWLASHPPLAERIRRLLGRVPPDLPAEPVDMADEPDAPDFLAPLTTAALVAAQPGTATGPAATGLATDAPTAAVPRAALGSPAPDCLVLPPWSAPSAIRQAVLAFLVPGPSSPAHATWVSLMGDDPATPPHPVHPALAAVWALPPRQRQPWLAHALQRARSLPAGPKAQTLHEAHALVHAAGHATLSACLTLALIRHTLTAADASTQPAAAAPRRPLSLADAAPDIWLVSLALGQLTRPTLPETQTATATGHLHLQPQPPIHAHAQAWALAVVNALGLTGPGQATVACADSGWAALPASIQRLAELGPLQQPALVKQWIQSGGWQPAQPMGQPPGQPLAQPLADALHSLCLLIGSPMPPPLQACFDALPDTVSASLRPA